MPSLKEVKNRINSVNSTRKITSAMKMVASAKLHGAQKLIENMQPYQHRIERVMQALIATLDADVQSAYAVERPVNRVAVIVLTSNSSLCGAFNSNVIRLLDKRVETYKKSGVTIDTVYAIGRKGAEAAQKKGLPVKADYNALLDHTNYEATTLLAEEIMQRFVDGEIDHVDLIYQHFVSTGKQVLTEDTFLPAEVASTDAQAGAAGGQMLLDYIVEPSKEELITKLIPRALHLKLYTALLDSLASERDARVVAMQVATDNADEMLHDLTLQYNKTRQQAITAELLDIVGGSMQ